MKSGKYVIELFKNDERIDEIGYQKTLSAAKSVADQAIQKYMQKNDEYAICVFDTNSLSVKKHYSFRGSYYDFDESEPVYSVGNYDTDKRKAPYDWSWDDENNYSNMDNVCAMLKDLIEEKDKAVISGGSLDGLTEDEVCDILYDELGDKVDITEVDYKKEEGRHLIIYDLAYMADKTDYHYVPDSNLYGILLKYRQVYHDKNLIACKVIKVSDYLGTEE